MNTKKIHFPSTANKVLLLSALMLLLASCYSVKKAVEDSRPLSSEIHWPEAYAPEESRFFVHNQIDIDASAEVVWEILIHAAAWEDYYEGATNLILLDNTSGQLDEHSEFTWKTMGLDFKSVIKEFEAPYRLSWESRRKDIQGYHAWLIIPTAEGSKLITSEAQHGFMTVPQKLFVPNKLHGLHDIWLAEIKQRAEALGR